MSSILTCRMHAKGAPSALATRSLTQLALVSIILIRATAGILRPYSNGALKN